MDYQQIIVFLFLLLGASTGATAWLHTLWTQRKHLVRYVVIDGVTLEAPAEWYCLQDGVRARLINGIGPDRWPAEYRTTLNLLTGFRPAADIHDVEYAVFRTRRERLAADRRFLLNCLRIMWYEAGGLYGLLRSPGRTLRRFLIARMMYRALRLFGRQAFDESSKVDVAVRGEDALPILPNDEEPTTEI